MGVQFIKSPSGEDMVLLSREQYDELIRIAEEAAEDAADVAAYDAAKAEGIEIVPMEVSRHITAGTGLLKAYRLWRSLSQVELAERSHTSQGHISDIESRRRKITPDLAPKLAAALDIPVDWLI
jgi:antitoxin component HigA of HigAB toxin-antitoxin module